jgi:hypothetical protein
MTKADEKPVADLRSIAKTGQPSSIVRKCFPDLRAIILALLVCVLVPSVLVLTHIRVNSEFSPIDEGAHFDYVQRASLGQIPRIGDRLLQSSMQTVDCRGISGVVVARCAKKAIPTSSFPGSGYNYEAQQPPTYYFMTVPLRWAFIHVLGMSLVSGTRAAGLVWLDLGLLLFWSICRLWGLGVSRTAGGALLIASLPGVVYYSSIISNDAPSIFLGCFVAFVATLSLLRPRRVLVPVLLFVTGLLTASFKAVDIFPVVVVSGMMLAYYLREQRRRPDAANIDLRALGARWITSGGALLAGGAISLLGWVVASRTLATVNLRTLPFLSVLRVHPTSVWTIAQESTLMFLPLTGSYSAYQDVYPNSTGFSNLMSAEAVVIAVAGYLLIAGGLSGMFVVRKSLSNVLGLMVLPCLYVGGLLLGIGIWTSYNADPGLGSRYGLSLAPLLVLALIGSLRERWTSILVWSIGIASTVLTMALMLYPH